MNLIHRSISIALLFLMSVAAQNIALDSILNHCTFLGSDLLAGRGTGSAGEFEAAAYLAKMLQLYNVHPGAEDNTFFQTIPMHGSYPLSDSQLLLISSGDTISLILNEDYLLFKSGVQTFIPTPIPMVFVGYGIIAPEYDYNDYQSVDAAGKIVVFLSGEPYSEDPNYFSGKHETIYSHIDSKQRIAISRGARGSIMLLRPEALTGLMNWSYWQRQFQFEDITLAYTVSGNLSLVLHNRIAELLFKNESMILPEIYQMDQKGTMRSFNLSVKLSFRGIFKERDFTTRNVVGLCPARADSYIIVSAHYDHLGIGPAVRGDSIYNGVNDNALGVAVLLEISRNLAVNKEKIKRSIIALFTTGEEKGLLGSTYYTDHPVYPLYKTAANINIDGIAIFDQFKSVIAIGSALSSLEQLLTAFLSNKGLGLCKDDAYTNWVPRSDQFAFAKAGIPSVLIQDGCDYIHLSTSEAMQKMRYWQETIYHSPFDDLSQEIHYDAVMQHSQLLYEFITMLANSDKEPTWNEGVPFRTIRLQTIAEKR